MGVLSSGLRRFCLSLLLLLPASSVHADSDTETKVKAAFIINFVPFVKWPSETLSNAADPFTICTDASAPLEQALKEAAQNKSMREHPFVVRKLRKESDVQSCQVAFYSGSATVKAAPGVLTIADNSATPAASEAGVIVFVLQANRVRFAINIRLAENAGLEISSKLLVLATKVDQ